MVTVARKKFRLYLKSIFITLIALICTSTVIICYPQLYYFDDKIEYKNFQVYYDKKIPDQIYAILDAVDQSIRKSDVYDPELKFKIFLRSDADRYNALPLQFPDDCIGWTIPVIKNVYLYKSDCATNISYTRTGHKRTLSSVIAHELMHVLVENKWLLKSKTAYFDRDSLSPFGALWKEEGYAEYIAGEMPINLEEGLKLLSDAAALKYGPHFEYFKYWLAVRHLILKKNMSFEDILFTKLNLDDVLNEAKCSETNI